MTQKDSKNEKDKAKRPRKEPTSSGSSKKESIKGDQKEESIKNSLPVPSPLKYRIYRQETSISSSSIAPSQEILGELSLELSRREIEEIKDTLIRKVLLLRQTTKKNPDLDTALMNVVKIIQEL